MTRQIEIKLPDNPDTRERVIQGILGGDMGFAGSPTVGSFTGMFGGHTASGGYARHHQSSLFVVAIHKHPPFRGACVEEAIRRRVEKVVQEVLRDQAEVL